MNKFLKILLLITFSILFFNLSSTKLHALSYTYPKYDVDIKINADSSFDVKESSVYKFYGETHGLRRDLTLYDPYRDCSGENTCGGFDRVDVLSVTDNKGNDLKGKYTTYQVEDDSGKISLRVEWEIWPNGNTLNGDEIGWVINYRIYGGIQAIGGYPYFYWNVLPEDRGGSVDSSAISITFPKDVILNESNLIFYDSTTPYTIDSINNTVKVNESNLGSFSNYTVSYQFNKNEITLPGNINYTIDSPEFNNEVYLDDKLVNTDNFGKIKSVPAGTHKVSFKHTGYQTIDKTVDIKSGEDTNLEVSLQPEAWMSILIFLNYVMILCGCILIPGALIFVYMHYRSKGRDKDMPKTIIPLYSPPENVAPYLLGSIKDESVDKEDIIGTIIDLAYRGYIKIKELEKDKNYELTLQDPKKGDQGLDEIEGKIIDALFLVRNTEDGNVIVESKDLKYRFPSKYSGIVSRVYSLMVDRGYFSRSPLTTIGMYIGFGIFLTIISVISTVFLSTILTNILGVFSIFTPGIALAFAGIALMMIAKFMPAKTSSGSKVYADILGFKMYLNTAERFRLQKLGPEEFEKYLSYAIVFGIEKDWAKKFEGIYKGVPDWYEGTGNVYDAVWISSFTRSFANSTISNITPVSSGTGSGWSGSSGSFGGFSGGGGGGGSSGAW